MITSWSHSRVTLFEQCKFRAWLLHEEKVPEPPRPLPPGKTEHANDRGTRIHNECEDYVSGKTEDMPVEAARFFKNEMEVMRQLYAAGRVSLEGEWGMNQAWEPTGWRGAWMPLDSVKEINQALQDCEKPFAKPEKTLPEYGSAGDVIKVGKTCYIWVPAWLRLKLDALVFLSDDHALAIDYKSGKRFGNEIKHGEQLQLYQLVTFLRYPKLERVTTELWYLDCDELTSQSFTRAQGLRFMKTWDRRGTALTTANSFPPNPNKFSCRYCMYGPWGTGHCKVGVK